MAALLRRASTSLPRHLAAARSPPSAAIRRHHCHTQIQIQKTWWKIGSTALLVSFTALGAVHMSVVHIMDSSIPTDAEELFQARVKKIKSDLDSMVKHAVEVELADKARRTRSAED